MSIDRLLTYCDLLASEIRCGEIILVGGYSRSGKTTFAEHLRSSCLKNGLNVWTISLDRWLKNLLHRTPGVMGRYDLSDIQKILLMRKGGYKNSIRLQLPEYNKFIQRQELHGESILISPKDVLIIEGTIALTLTSHAIHARCFYVEVDEFVRRRRVIDEYISRGKTTAEAEKIYADRQLDETPVIKQSSSRATFLTTVNFSAQE